MTVDGWRNVAAASEHRGGYEVSTRIFRTGELLSPKTRVGSIKIDCQRWGVTPIPVLL
jgi:hypothetical protein